MTTAEVTSESGFYRLLSPEVLLQADHEGANTDD